MPKSKNLLRPNRSLRVKKKAQTFSSRPSTQLINGRSTFGVISILLYCIHISSFFFRNFFPSSNPITPTIYLSSLYRPMAARWVSITITPTIDLSSLSRPMAARWVSIIISRTSRNFRKAQRRSNRCEPTPEISRCSSHDKKSDGNVSQSRFALRRWAPPVTCPY